MHIYSRQKSKRDIFGAKMFGDAGKCGSLKITVANKVKPSNERAGEACETQDNRIRKTGKRVQV